MIVLYKNGAASPPLHAIDANAWRNLGWSDSPEVEAKSVEPSPDAEEQSEAKTEVSPRKRSSKSSED